MAGVITDMMMTIMTTAVRHMVKTITMMIGISPAQEYSLWLLLPARAR
jgi:hypothetical protein